MRLLRPCVRACVRVRACMGAGGRAHACVLVCVRPHACLWLRPLCRHACLPICMCLRAACARTCMRCTHARTPARASVPRASVQSHRGHYESGHTERIPGRCAAPPAPAMMTFSPRPAAPGAVPASCEEAVRRCVRMPDRGEGRVGVRGTTPSDAWRHGPRTHPRRWRHTRTCARAFGVRRRSSARSCAPQRWHALPRHSPMGRCGCTRA